MYTQQRIYVYVYKQYLNLIALSRRHDYMRNGRYVTHWPLHADAFGSSVDRHR